MRQRHLKREKWTTNNRMNFSAGEFYFLQKISQESPFLSDVQCAVSCHASNNNLTFFWLPPTHRCPIRNLPWVSQNSNKICKFVSAFSQQPRKLKALIQDIWAGDREENQKGRVISGKNCNTFIFGHQWVERAQRAIWGQKRGLNLEICARHWTDLHWL